MINGIIVFLTGDIGAIVNLFITVALIGIMVPLFFIMKYIHSTELYKLKIKGRIALELVSNLIIGVLITCFLLLIIVIVTRSVF